MSAKTVNRLDDKDSFVDLTPKQKVVVNALAEHPDEGPKRIAEIASEALDDDTVSRSYVHPIKQKYGHLVEKQREIKENKRYEGTEKTTGDPFESLNQSLSEDSGGWQTFSERPYKGDSEAQEESEGDTSGRTQATLQAELTRSDVENLLSGEVPEEFRRLLMNRMVERAFKTE